MQSSIPTFTAGVVSLCMFCTLSLTTIERHPQMDYTRITDSRISMTSTYMGYTEMSENLGERVARLEERTDGIPSLHTKIDKVLEKLNALETSVANISTDTSWLKKGFWFLCGVCATTVGWLLSHFLLKIIK